MEERLVEAGGLRLRVAVGECVYPPMEDSELALEALSLLARSGARPMSALDIGTGTGVLALGAYKLFRPPLVAATDISPYAVRTALHNLRETGALVARCFLARCLRPGWDLVTANPPYLPVKDSLEGECGRYEALSWGWPGMAEAFCREAAAMSRQYVVIVDSSLSGYDARSCLAEEGFRVLVGVERRFFMEKLIAYAAVRR